ncbi:hypothetical protein RB195_023623 [Necator americanus]|uniref:Uncharacterized protein n=1 Tax=Necator americanus TaxID=51031 RepID=A0ABR1EMB2_NECAM
MLPHGGVPVTLSCPWIYRCWWVLLFANHHFQFKWIVVFAVGCVTLSMIDSSILCRLSRVVYASFSPDQLPSNSNSSLGPPSSTEKPRTQSHELVDTIVDAHELTAQVRHLKPLLQTQVKYVHTPLIQYLRRVFAVPSHIEKEDGLRSFFSPKSSCLTRI